MKKLCFFVFISLFLFSCSDKSVNMNDAEKLEAAKVALAQIPARQSMTQITKAVVSNVEYKVFDKIKKNVNGIELSVLPMKISGNVLYEQNVFVSLIHAYANCEATIHIYKNEVNEIKIDLISMGHIPRLLRRKDIIELSSKYPAACGGVLY